MLISYTDDIDVLNFACALNHPLFYTLYPIHLYFTNLLSVIKLLEMFVVRRNAIKIGQVPKMYTMDKKFHECYVDKRFYGEKQLRRKLHGNL